MVIRQAFLSLLLFTAISNSSNTPDLVEEVDGTFTSPYMKYNTKRPDDFDDDDSMSDDTSWSADEDREMAETADKSYVINTCIILKLQFNRVEQCFVVHVDRCEKY